MVLTLEVEVILPVPVVVVVVVLVVVVVVVVVVILTTIVNQCPGMSISQGGTVCLGSVKKYYF